MALGFRGVGALLESSAAFLTIDPIAGQENTDISFMFLTLKGCTIATPPTGWEQLIQAANGTTPIGPDTGSVRLVVYYRGGVTPEATFEVTTAANSSVVGRIATWTRDEGDFYQFLATSGSDAAHGVDFSAACTDNLFAVADDLLIAAAAVNTDAGSRTGPLITATGLVVATPVSLIDDQSMVGYDSGLYVVEAGVTSGTETAAPSFAFSNSSASSGAGVVIKLKRTVPVLAIEPIDNFSVTAGYTVTASGLDGFGEYQIQRIDTAAGTGTEDVRGAGRQTLSGRTTAVVSDYEFHFKSETGDIVTCRWDLLLYLSGKLQGTVSSELRTPLTDAEDSLCYDPRISPFAWIKHCTTPQLNQPVSVGEFEGYERAGRILGKHNVLGRSKPVVITDVLTSSEGTFTVLVDAESAWIGAESVVKYNKDLRLLFDSGGVYYFQTLDPFAATINDFYFTVETASVKRQNRWTNPDVNPTTVWSIKFIEVDRPAALDVSTLARTWGTVLLEFATWGAVKNSEDIWLDVLLGD